LVTKKVTIAVLLRPIHRAIEVARLLPFELHPCPLILTFTSG